MTKSKFLITALKQEIWEGRLWSLKIEKGVRKFVLKIEKSN